MVLSADKPAQCMLLGDAMVGKSSLVQTFMNQRLPWATYVATVLETYRGCVDVEGQKQKLSVIDYGGQQDYHCFRLWSYKYSDVLVLCYSVVDRNSLDSIKEFWVPEVNTCGRRRKPIILVATQVDLREDGNPENISEAEGEIVAKDIGASAFVECTALDKDSVNHVFEVMSATALKYKKRRSSFVRKMFGR